MMMDINLEAGHIVEITTAPSTSPKKISVPILGLEKFPTQQEIEGQDVRNRRPVRPIDRQRMRPWLMELLDLGNVFGLRWTNRNQGIFQISWRHASRLGWNLETDGDVFERWARHTGIYKEGDPPEPKRWKANFRCALHSLHDVMELTNAVERRGRNACRTYQFLQNNNSTNPKSRSKEKRQKPIEPKESRELVRVLTYDRSIRQPVQFQLQQESGSSDELLSETESEGSHQDKVIVQRLDPKSGEVGEEFILHHDHDYSGHTEKTQRTIYLRQGVGSIVLHKEVLNVPQVMEDAKAAQALSNLEQLASAAVGTQGHGEGTIMIDANVLTEGSEKGSPTKSSILKDDSTELNLKTLLPRLRARIKESERAGGLVRKRKYLEEDPELDEKRILGHSQYRIKKAKSEVGGSPPSPPMTRRRSSSPKKQTKNTTAKTKRNRKESEGSASDSTEPLMSSCLLLLEAATRLDNAEKRSGLSDRTVSKHGKRVGGKASDTPVSSKKRKGLRSERKNEEEEFEEGQEEEEVIEEAVIEGIEETVLEGEEVVEGGSEETVIEEKIIYPEDTVQIVFEEATDEGEGQTIKTEVVGEDDQVVYADILRTTLENIGSEMEVSSTPWELSTPKEMAIMRRKKDSERSAVYNALTLSGGQIVVTEASFAKGLFSGSEIVPNISQTASNVKKATRVKSKSSSNKDNIYYVDVRSNGGSISVRQSDGVVINSKDTSLPQFSAGGNVVVSGTSGIPQTIIQKELPILSAVQKLVTQGSTSTSVIQGGPSTTTCSPQIFIAAGQNASGQPLILPINNQKTNAVASSSLNSADYNTLKPPGSKSFINLAAHGKPIILKPNTSSAVKGIATTSIPVINQIGPQVMTSSVKISTLPIISTLKPIVSIPAPVTSGQRRLASPTVTSNSAYPVHLVPNIASTSHISGSSGGQQTMTFVPTQIGSMGQGAKTILLQQQISSNTASTKKQSKPLKFHMPTAPTVSASTTSSQGEATVQTHVLASPLSSTSMSTVFSVKEEKEDIASDTINAQVVMDPVRGPYLKLPMASTFPLSQNIVLSSSSSTSQSLSQELGSGSSNETQKSNQENESVAEQTIDAEHFDEVEVYSSNVTQKFLESLCNKSKEASSEIDSIVEIKPEPSENSLNVPQNEGEDGLVVAIQQEEKASSVQDSCSVPLQDEDIHVRPSPASAGAAIRVEVQSEMGDQTCYISPEQLEQANHIIHISQEEMEEGNSSKLDPGSVQEQSEEGEQVTVFLDNGNVKTEAEDDSSCVVDASSSSMSIDPRAPLAIREIPLFASSKGDQESVDDPGDDIK